MFRKLTSGKESGWLHRKAHKLVLCTFPGSRLCFANLFFQDPQIHTTQIEQRIQMLWRNCLGTPVSPSNPRGIERRKLHLLHILKLLAVTFLPHQRQSFSRLPTLK